MFSCHFNFLFVSVGILLCLLVLCKSYVNCLSQFLKLGCLFPSDLCEPVLSCVICFASIFFLSLCFNTVFSDEIS